MNENEILATRPEDGIMTCSDLRGSCSARTTEMDEGLYVDLGVMPTILTAEEAKRLGDKAEACHRLGDTLPDVADALLAEYPPEDLKSPDFKGDPMTVAMLRRRWPNALHSVLMRRAYALLGDDLHAFIWQRSGLDQCVIVRPDAAGTYAAAYPYAVHVKPEPDLGSALVEYRLGFGNNTAMGQWLGGHVPMSYEGFGAALRAKVDAAKPALDECLFAMFCAVI